MKLLVFFIGFLFLPVAVFAHADEQHIFVAPPIGEFTPGEVVAMEVRVESLDPITSFRIQLNYDSPEVDVQEIIANTDTFPFWWTQIAEDGFIILEASVPSPGFSGESVVATILFEPREDVEEFPTLVINEEQSLLLNAEDQNILVEEVSGNSGQLSVAQASGTPNNLGFIMGVILLVGLGIGALIFLRARSH